MSIKALSSMISPFDKVQARVPVANCHRRFLAIHQRSIVVAFLSVLGPALGPYAARAQSRCRIESTTFDGWKAQQLSNEWVKVIIVPQLGGRVMQVTLGGHPYLFVNARYKGQYLPPSEGVAKGRWFNYGGDKIWPLPEGTEDEQHWAGPLSDALDDGQYSFKILSQSPACSVQLQGPADTRTGLQYSRDIRIESDSPQISFHAVMKNASGHPIQWSVQSVSQYDTADSHDPKTFNHNFWAFTPANPHSSYPVQYHVRSGAPDDPSFSVKGGVFTLHWMDLQSEVWIDSPGDWVAVVDADSHYAMVERFAYLKGKEYPGDASVIFYKSGAPEGKTPHASANPDDPDDALLYMEAELNSPLVRLQPGESFAMDTQWFPTRLATDFHGVADAGLIGRPLEAAAAESSVTLSGSFGVFFKGTLTAHLYDEHGLELSIVSLQKVDPAEPVSLREEIKSPPPGVARVSLHLVDWRGSDRGSLGEAHVNRLNGGN